MKPTPTPWTLGRINKRSQTAFIDAMHRDPEMGHETWQEMIQCNGCHDLPDKGIEKAEANARFVVKAVNYHDRLREALAWYGEQSENCRKFGPKGEAARQVLDKDGGELARTLLTQLDNLEKQP